MVKFSVFPTLVSWIIVFPYFLCLANRTGGRYRRAEAPDRNIEPGIAPRPVDDDSYVTSKTLVPNSAAQESRNKLSTPRSALLNDSSIGSGHASSLDTTGSDDSSRVISEAVYYHDSMTPVKPPGLTLMDMNGPLINREGDDPAAKSSHIRVKRGLNYADEGIANYSRDDDRSNARNDLEDIYPDAIDDSLRQSSGSELVRRRRLDHGTLLPASSDSKIPAVSSPSKYGASLHGSQREDTLTRRPLMRRRKRYAQARDRKTRKGAGGRHHKGGKSKHPRKHTKKHKKAKKPGAARAGTSHLVDDLQVEAHVEKRDSGDAKSEIEINKRDVSGKSLVSRDKRTIEDGRNSAKQRQDDPGSDANEKSNEESKSISKPEKVRRSGCGNEDPRYYDDVHEPLDDIGPLFDPGDKMRKKTATRSVQQIRELVEKLTGKVDEIESYLKSGNEEGSSNPVRSVDRADLKNATKDVEAGVRADETEASKSKLDMKTSVGKEGVEQKEKTPEGSTELKRSTRILKRSQASKKSRHKRKPHRKWDRWTDWSSCSVTCGKGRQIRWRHCTHDCTLAETEMEEKSCQLPACSPGKFLGIF